MVFRNCLGMIMSVSTLAMGSGAATPFRTENFCMVGSGSVSVFSTAILAARQRDDRRQRVVRFKRDGVGGILDHVFGDVLNRSLARLFARRRRTGEIDGDLRP